MRDAVSRCQLNLDGAIVLTEAATGAYAVTPVLAAMGGAGHVYAVTRATRFGNVDEVIEQTLSLAQEAGMADRITIGTTKEAGWIQQADIVTNSGHVRPIDTAFVGAIKPGTVIPLMYEAWEFREGDIDLEACRRRGLTVVGTNERHPSINVFSYLGMMAVKQLLDAAVPAHGSSILLLCDNDFAPFIKSTLDAACAHVVLCASLDEASLDEPLDAIIVALQPKTSPVITEEDVRRIASCQPGVVVMQYWGDVDRSAFETHQVQVWPMQAPAPGHMGVLVSEVGPDPIVRLQIGGLKAAEVMRAHQRGSASADLSFAQVMVKP
jgi:hypothetical protein